MKTLFYYFIVSIFAFYSCDSKKNIKSKDQKISIIGKWHRFSNSNGYSEFDIDSQYVVFFNQKTGRIKLEYKIENDSFKYISNKYAAKIIFYNDSIFLKGNDYTTATLYRFKEPVPFVFIPEEKDSLLFDSYVNGFDKRLVREYEKAGIQFLDNSKEGSDTTQTFEQLLYIR